MVYHDDDVDEKIEVGKAPELLVDILGQEIQPGVLGRDYLVVGVLARVVLGVARSVGFGGLVIDVDESVGLLVAGGLGPHA